MSVPPIAIANNVSVLANNATNRDRLALDAEFEKKDHISYSGIPHRARGKSNTFGKLLSVNSSQQPPHGGVIRDDDEETVRDTSLSIFVYIVPGIDSNSKDKLQFEVYNQGDGWADKVRDKTFGLIYLAHIVAMMSKQWDLWDDASFQC